MDHRDQMKNNLTNKEFLLQNSLTENEKPAIYSLEAEFAKTKRNREIKPILIVLGFVIMLFGITLWTVSYLEHQSKQINIDISDFEDLRLKEALSEAMETNADLEGYHYALQMFLKDKKAAGCVIDPRQSEDILIYITQEVTSEITINLYRSNNTYVGKIRLIPEGEEVRAEMVATGKKVKIKPLDWFRLPK